VADVYDRWHKSHPRVDEDECGEHKSRTRRMIPTTDHGVGKRWQVRYRDLNGNQRKENYETKAEADKRAAKVDNELHSGTYVDPTAGKVTLASYAQQWLSSATAGPTTVERYERAIRNHIEPHLGRRELRTLNRPSAIQAWVKQLQAAGLEASTIGGVNDVLVSILDAAVDDGLVSRNPCRSSSVKLPTRTKKKIVPWSLERAHAVIAGLPPRFQVGGKLAFGCGLRQGEVFGFAEDDIDFGGLEIHVNRQIRIVRNKLVVALPKGNRIRGRADVTRDGQRAEDPHPDVRARGRHAALGRPEGQPRTYRLLFTDAKGKPYNRSVFNQGDWKRALVVAGVIPPRTTGSQYFAAAPDDGMHALRHAYASVLLDAGETIKALAEYLGHSDPGLTLRTYTHLMPSSAARTRRAVDQALALTSDEGTSRAMCPQCALAT
jgi:integrase